MQFIKSVRFHYLAVGMVILAAMLIAAIVYFEYRQLAWCADHKDELSSWLRCARYYQ